MELRGVFINLFQTVTKTTTKINTFFLHQTKKVFLAKEMQVTIKIYPN